MDMDSNQIPMLSKKGSTLSVVCYILVCFSELTIIALYCGTNLYRLLL